MGKMNEDEITRALHILPENGRELVRLIGLKLTMKLVELLGGTHFPIPKTAKQEGQYLAALSEVVGVDAAKVLIQHYGNTRLYVPKCTYALKALRDANIRADYDRHCRELGHNATVNNILVPKYSLCDRRLEKILDKVDQLLPDDTMQGQLF